MKATINNIVRLRNSMNGNPRFRIHYSYVAYPGAFHTDDFATTASDHSFAYEIGNKGYRVGDTVELSFSGRGTITGMARI